MLVSGLAVLCHVLVMCCVLRCAVLCGLAAECLMGHTPGCLQHWLLNWRCSGWLCGWSCSLWMSRRIQAVVEPHCLITSVRAQMYLCPPVCSTIPPYQTRVLLLFRRTGFFVSAAPDGSVVLLQPSDTPDTFCSSASWVVRPGLDGQEGSVSLESAAQHGESA